MNNTNAEKRRVCQICGSDQLSTGETGCGMIMNQEQIPTYKPLFPVQTTPTTSIAPGNSRAPGSR